MRRKTVRMKIALGCFLLIAVVAVGVGLRYSFAPRIMSYHQQALGVDWDDLSPREQMLLLALLRGTGLCALVTGIAVGTLVLIPFRRGESWARWALAVLCLTTLLPAAWEAFTLAATTGAATPWPLLLGAILLVLVGFSLAGPVATGPGGASVRDEATGPLSAEDGGERRSRRRTPMRRRLETHGTKSEDREPHMAPSGSLSGVSWS